MSTLPVEHEAGVYAGLVQRCVRCLEVLADHRNAAWPADSEPPRPWPEGARLVKRGSCWATRAEGSGPARLCVPSEHIAGEPVGGEQRCSSCGLVLLRERGDGGYAPVGELVVATESMVMPRTRWDGPTLPCGKGQR